MYAPNFVQVHFSLDQSGEMTSQPSNQLSHIHRSTSVATNHSNIKCEIQVVNYSISLKNLTMWGLSFFIEFYFH